jgi:hypothetical protein
MNGASGTGRLRNDVRLEVRDQSLAVRGNAARTEAPQLAAFALMHPQSVRSRCNQRVCAVVYLL